MNRCLPKSLRSRRSQRGFIVQAIRHVICAQHVPRKELDDVLVPLRQREKARVVFKSCNSHL